MASAKQCPKHRRPTGGMFPVWNVSAYSIGATAALCSEQIKNHDKTYAYLSKTRRSLSTAFVDALRLHYDGLVQRYGLEYALVRG